MRLGRCQVILLTCFHQLVRKKSLPLCPVMCSGDAGHRCGCGRCLAVDDVLSFLSCDTNHAEYAAKRPKMGYTRRSSKINL